MSGFECLFDFELNMQYEDFEDRDTLFDDYDDEEHYDDVNNLDLDYILDLKKPANTYSPNSRVLHSNRGRGRGRGGWRSQSGNTNCRTYGGNSRLTGLNLKQESGNKKVITVPSHKVGRIIGKGGCKIRDLVLKSGAKIKIGDSSGNETTVTLFGSQEATLKVEGLINKLLEDRRPAAAAASREHFNNSCNKGIMFRN